MKIKKTVLKKSPGAKPAAPAVSGANASLAAKNGTIGKKAVATTFVFALIALFVSGDQMQITIRNIKVSAGAGFIVAYAGSIIAMPGLPKVPAANSIDIDDNGSISGLF